MNTVHTPPLKVHLIVYQLQLIIDPVSSLYQKLFSTWNHCAIQVDDVVIHFYDDLHVPRWTSIDADLKLSHPRESLFIGEINWTWPQVRSFTNSLPNMRKIDYIYRYLSPITAFHFPKKHNDCIHKCSVTLNKMFGSSEVITSTPDDLLLYMKEYHAQGR